MKKIFVLGFFSLFFNVFTFAQYINFFDTIYWLDNKIFMYNDDNTINIMSFKDGSNRKSDYLPVYFKSFNVSENVDITNVELINTKYETVSENILKNIENIKSEPEYNINISVFRKQHYLKFELVPLRKNSFGAIERLVSFECKITYSPKGNTKTQKNKTYTSQSKLANGKWYKIKIKESGIYKITYSQLLEMGFTDFNNIGVFGYGGMLSKFIDDSYIDDLPERPVYKVDANSNGIFDKDDYLLFYADEANNVYYSEPDKNFKHEIHNYSEYSYYFISDKGSWKQAITENSLTNSDISLTSYSDYKFLEKDSLNIAGSGRRLFWSVYDYNLTQRYTKTFDNVNFAEPVNVEVVMAVKSTASSSFSVKFNGSQASSATVNGLGAYEDNIFARTGTVNKSFTTNSNTFNVEITYTRSASASKAWLDYIAFSFKRNLSLNTGIVQFRDIANLGNNKNTKFIISNATQNSIVWDITDRFNVSRIQGSFNNSNSNYEFTANTNTLREFIAFTPSSNFPSPIISGSSDVGNINNQNLHSLQSADLIIVTHSSFYSQAQEIKTLHEQYDNMSVIITTPNNIYNEFSSGTPDISAIRNFVKMIYDKANPKNLPQNLLLFGDGTYYNLPNLPKTSLILTYQSYESLVSSLSYVSDDFYVFMDEGEGGFNNKDDIDMGVGRITVNTVAEAQNYVNKLKSYYSSDSYSNWKNNILLIADDADGGETIFQTSTKGLAEFIQSQYPEYNIEHLYLDDYKQVTTIQGQRYPDVNQSFDDAMHNGVFLINWFGHGSPKSWAHEQILTVNMIKSWKNTNKYPIFITSTCEFAPYDEPDLVSGGEEVLLNPTGGGIALYTTTRKVGTSSGDYMSKNFLKFIFAEDDNSNINTLGMSVAKTKLELSSSSYNKSDYTVLGDPAIRPSIPRKIVETTKINGININEFNDTIKAKSLTTFEGVIKNKNGNIDENFNGIVYPVVFDKFLTYKTRSNDGYPSMEYEAQKNMIFKGQAKVVNGRFSFSFIVPVDIVYFCDNGKVSYYATNNLLTSEASGYFNTFMIGGSDTTAITDNEGPEIKLFMNDEKFISGGLTNENPLLIANIKDESGINTVGNGIGHDLTMILNDNDANKVVLNKFYEADLDSYKSGKINYKISNLQVGYHNIKVKAWDIFNNSNEESLDFIVVNSTELSLDHVFNYPNPFSNNTHFYFSHNQANVNLDVLIQIFTISGKHVRSIYTNVYSDGFQSSPIHWDGLDEFGDKIAKGVYIYKVIIKSPQGKKAEKIEKLMILN